MFSLDFKRFCYMLDNLCLHTQYNGCANIKLYCEGIAFLAQAFIQVPLVEYFEKLSKFICNQYLSYLHLFFESILLPLKSHHQRQKYS